ncbi:MAG: ATP-binding protein, partial [Nitrospinota bacterium]
MKGELELEVPAESRFLSLISILVRDVGQAFGFEGRALKELELALDEACANVIEHGIEGEGDDTLEVCFQPFEGG